MEKTGLSCPVNDKQVNEIVIRLVAMQVIFAVVTALYFQNAYIAALLWIDFGVRAFGFSHLSPLRYIAQKAVTHFQLGYKASNEAPKKFAATVGFVVMGSLTVLVFLEYSFTATIIGGFLLLFATLESVFGICVGCVVYQQLARFR
jgi:apolipoprotein N-acyltransferase